MTETTKRQKKDKKISSSSSKKMEVIQEEITKAINAVTYTKFRTAQLQSQWRDHLLRMSYLVGLIVMHQLSSPVTACIKELKGFDGYQISGITALTVLLRDSMVEITNVVIAIFLFRFLTLRDPHGNFQSRSYCVAATLVTFALGMFFNEDKELQAQGCVAHLGEDISIDAGEAQVVKRQFPVSCVFHVIVTGCYWFMKMGMDQCDTNVEAMMKLQKELIDSKSTQKDDKKKK
mmetsp:Transcript_4578/g.5962  ORF Transcript_4578/g.5962 Transcript_4578/m.5962 type:complete len:233 (+) Transcript_4578:66-764(+)